MIRLAVYVILCIFYSTDSFGELTGFNKVSNDYFRNLERTNTPAIYATCKTQEGKALVVFGLDGTKGKIFELRNNEVVNSASIIIKLESILIDIENTQGGIYTYTLMANYAKDILKLPFTFVMPENVKNILNADPNHLCVNKPPEY